MLLVLHKFGSFLNLLFQIIGCVFELLDFLLFCGVNFEPELRAEENNSIINVNIPKSEVIQLDSILVAGFESHHYIFALSLLSSPNFKNLLVASFHYSVNVYSSRPVGASVVHDIQVPEELLVEARRNFVDR